jgi:hypothetical protein
LGSADNDVGAVVGDETALPFRSRHHRVEIDIGFVALIVFAFATDAHLDEIEAGIASGVSSMGYIVCAPAMFTSSRSEGLSPTVSRLKTLR